MKKELEQLYLLSESIKARQTRIDRELSENEKNREQIKEILNNSGDLREMIIGSFGEIPEGGIETDLVRQKKVSMMNLRFKASLENLYFNPKTDDWEIVGVEKSPTGKFRFHLNVIKNSRSIGAFTKVLDTIWTAWI